MTESPLSQLEPLWNAEAVAWFAERLWPWEGSARVGSFIPEGFQRYARLLHPAKHPEEGHVPWSRIAEWSTKELHSTVNFEYLATRDDGQHWASMGAAPDEELDRSLCAHLGAILAEFTSTPGLCWYCVWFGYGDIKLNQPTIEITPRITSSGREYFLFRGAVTSVTNLEFPNAAQLLRAEGARDEGEDELIPPPSFHSPNFWWPEDHAWFVSTEIDGPSTYIGGSAQLIARFAPRHEARGTPSEYPRSV